MILPIIRETTPTLLENQQDSNSKKFHIIKKHGVSMLLAFRQCVVSKCYAVEV